MAAILALVDLTRILLGRRNGQPNRIDLAILLLTTISGFISALCFGLAREFLPLPRRAKAWFLGFVASGTFWMCLVLLFSFDVRMWTIFCLVLGVGLGFSLGVKVGGKVGPA